MRAPSYMEGLESKSVRMHRQSVFVFIFVWECRKSKEDDDDDDDAE